jgi:16S rRNA (adenine1518-N6/adenine1519-N6)-dimethyltransferase
MVRAKKSLGQHFLVDPIIVTRIVEALRPKPGDTILEIGPGEGVLTLPLVNSGADVVAVELDRRLAPRLTAGFEKPDNFRVIEADILTVDPTTIGLDQFALIGNLPYNITTPVMDWLMKYSAAVSRAVLMMQLEVAQRVTSPPGRRARSTISVLTKLYYDSEIICDVPPQSFRPAPKVNSAVVRFERHDRDYKVGNLQRFEKFVRNCFANKRKNLLNNLNSAYPIRRSEIEEILTEHCGSGRIRAEQLEIEVMIALSQTVFDRL